MIAFLSGRHDEVETCLLFIRAGRLVGRRSYAVRWSLDEDELLAGFLQQYYGKDTLIPPTVLLPVLSVMYVDKQ